MAEELRPPKGPWRIAQNEWNLQSPPWSGAIAIEDMSEPWLAVPGIVCYLTRGFGQEAAAALIAAAPEMADHVAVLTAEITRLRTELAALRPAPRAHNLGVPPIADSSAQHYVKLSKMFAEAEVTIERLRIENAALRTERDYERARFAKIMAVRWPWPAPQQPGIEYVALPIADYEAMLREEVRPAALPLCPPDPVACEAERQRMATACPDLAALVAHQRRVVTNWLAGQLAGLEPPSPPSPPYPRAHDLGMGQREPAWVTLGSDAPAPIAGMVAAALAPGPLPATHAAALPAKAMR